jgi:hypothetical protein
LLQLPLLGTQTVLVDTLSDEKHAGDITWSEFLDFSLLGLGQKCHEFLDIWIFMVHFQKRFWLQQSSQILNVSCSTIQMQIIYRWWSAIKNLTFMDMYVNVYEWYEVYQ